MPASYLRGENSLSLGRAGNNFAVWVDDIGCHGDRSPTGHHER
jgi:hypothetical protein